MPVGGPVLRDVEVVVMSLPPALGVEGLLGMSLLKRCRLVLDAPRHSLEMETD